ncbi:leucine-rich repeat-containing protein 27-like isoform X2 [Cheilinus undulatus]|uniref:leucine-rich repeat-containing protein 27-like isoform X2 n=1 Tax=Cheilinus undulatus TaxID=241271 RepID=UPI001BD20608|nr:leucine-rich repeat-containing protein 27-like isoform X2 [Cheilinus undulatus]
MTSVQKEKKEEEEKQEVPDQQLSFVFGNRFDKPQTPRITPEDAEPPELPEHYSAQILDLSRTNLKHVPDSVMKNSKLKNLYLRGNQIASIPGSLFFSLPNLEWLDLRDNRIETLPAEIGSHRCLKTLLLEGNPIQELPAELGKVITLNGLQLRYCPVIFPPQEILNQGVKGILNFLRATLANRPVSVTKTSPDAGDVSEVELPLVEKLQLSRLTGSSVEEQEESADEDELQRFRELKHKMMMLDRAELEDKKTHPPPVIKKEVKIPELKKKKAPGKAGIIPEQLLFDTQHRKTPEERRQAAMKELKEKQAIMEQRRKSQEVLRARLSQTKHDKPKKQGKPRNQEEDRAVPPQSQAPPRTTKELDESRSAQRLQRQIRACVETLEERRRNPTDTSSKQMAAERQDIKEMRMLQTQLLERKTTRERNPERHFRIFTANTFPNYS